MIRGRETLLLSRLDLGCITSHTRTWRDLHPTPDRIALEPDCPRRDETRRIRPRHRTTSPRLRHPQTARCTLSRRHVERPTPAHARRICPSGRSGHAAELRNAATTPAARLWFNDASSSFVRAASSVRLQHWSQTATATAFCTRLLWIVRTRTGNAAAAAAATVTASTTCDRHRKRQTARKHHTDGDAASSGDESCHGSQRTGPKQGGGQEPRQLLRRVREQPEPVHGGSSRLGVRLPPALDPSEERFRVDHCSPSAQNSQASQVQRHLGRDWLCRPTAGTQRRPAQHLRVRNSLRAHVPRLEAEKREPVSYLPSDEVASSEALKLCQ